MPVPDCLVALQHAAALARKASVARPLQGERDVEITVTEIGFVVRGSAIDGSGRRWSSLDLGWPEFESNPSLLANAVHLINDRLPGKVEL